MAIATPSVVLVGWLPSSFVDVEAVVVIFGRCRAIGIAVELTKVERQKRK